MMSAQKDGSIMASGSLRMLIIEENAVNTLDAARVKHMLTEFDTLAAFKKAIGSITINFDLSDQTTLKQGRRLNKDAEIHALSLLIYWMKNPDVTAAGSDLIFEYTHGGVGSHAATAALRLINEEETVRTVRGMSGWRRCVFLNDLMTKVVCDNRYPDLKTDGEQLIRAMMDDGVLDESANEQTIKRYVNLGKRCEKHTDILMRWEVFHQRDSLIDNISIVRQIF